MGYRRVPTIHTLTFGQYPGLEVRMKSIRIGKMRQVLAALDAGSDDVSDDEVETMINMVVENLVSWNLEDEEDGVVTPVPTTRESIDDLELDMVLAIAMTWMDQLTGPDKDLGKDSTSGATSAVPLPQMVDL